MRMTHSIKIGLSGSLPPVDGICHSSAVAVPDERGQHRSTEKGTDDERTSPLQRGRHSNSQLRVHGELSRKISSYRLSRYL